MSVSYRCAVIKSSIKSLGFGTLLLVNNRRRSGKNDAPNNKDEFKFARTRIVSQRAAEVVVIDNFIPRNILLPSRQALEEAFEHLKFSYTDQGHEIRNDRVLWLDETVPDKSLLCLVAELKGIASRCSTSDVTLLAPRLVQAACYDGNKSRYI